MNQKELLKKYNFKIRKNDKVLSPDTNKLRRKDVVLKELSKKEGFKDYKTLQKVTRTKRYKKFSEWYEKAQGLKPDKAFNKLFQKTKEGSRGKAQVELLRATTFQPSFQKERWLQLYL